jgi:hypothetical protein
MIYLTFFGTSWEEVLDPERHADFFQPIVGNLLDMASPKILH